MKNVQAVFNSLRINIGESQREYMSADKKRQEQILDEYSAFINAIQSEFRCYQAWVFAKGDDKYITIQYSPAAIEEYNKAEGIVDDKKVRTVDRVRMEIMNWIEDTFTYTKWVAAPSPRKGVEGNDVWFNMGFE